MSELPIIKPKAQITPVGKAIIALVVLGVIGGAGYHFRDNLVSVATDLKTRGQAVAQTQTPSNSNSSGQPGTTVAPTGDEIGTKEHPLTVSIVSFHGYAPALFANGSSLETQPGSLFAQEGVNVKFVIQDDIPTLATTFGSGQAQCSWRTIDQFSQESPNLRNAGLDAKGVVIVDNSRGADSLIGGSGIRSIEDLVGKKVALIQYSPSHGLIVNAINNSSLSGRQKQSIKLVFISPESGTAGVRAAYASNQVDAAVLWDPDLSLALKSVPGSHVVLSTKTASDVIYDMMVCDTRVLKNPLNQHAFQAFVSGWLKGIDASNKNPDAAVDALVKNEQFFALLEKEQGRPFIKSLLTNLQWTTAADNARILGLASNDGTSTYDRVFKDFDDIYREAGALANPNSPRINPSDSFDDRFIRTVVNADPTIMAQAKKSEYNFTKEDSAKAAVEAPALTKSISIDFNTGNADLTPKARNVIDNELVPLLKAMGAAPVRIEGNTDSRGNRATNLTLSQRRADAVASYLSDDWGFSAQRFSAKGNGSTKPACNEANPSESYQTLDGCRSYNRQTRVAVIPVK